MSNSIVDQKPCGAATSDSMSGPGCTVFVGYPLSSSMRASFLTPAAVSGRALPEVYNNYLKQMDRVVGRNRGWVLHVDFVPDVRL
jgi:hypothetical protein